MKRLIKKSNIENEILVGEDVNISDDSKYQNLTIDDLSMPSNRDGVVIVDTLKKDIHWGLNGETHADIVREVYQIDDHDDDSYEELDDYVAYGIYLKDFLNNEAIVFYEFIPGIVEIIKSSKANISIYEGTSDAKVIERIALKKA